MAIEFRCDYCGRQLSLADGLGGRETTCPNCGVTLHVPAPDLGSAPTMPLQGLAPAPSSAPPLPALNPKLKQASELSLILGLVGLLLCQLAGPFAVWQWRVARDLAREEGVETPGLALAGLITGAIASFFLALSLLFLCGFLGLMVVGAAQAGGG